MDAVRVRRGRRADSEAFLDMVEALAEFEHLEPPSQDGKKRLINDIFDLGRLHLLVASSQGSLIGYALYYFAYSSFLARRTLYLEDIFVLEEHRAKGTGSALFRRCAHESVRNDCGRMEWAVLGWNRKAIGFYEGLGAKRLEAWEHYRLTDGEMENLLRTAPWPSRWKESWKPCSAGSWHPL